MPQDKNTGNIYTSRLNPAQKEAVESRSQSVLIVAGAGTGKTKTITERIARLIREGENPSRICGLTFTNKAAKEMKERVARLVQEEKGDLPAEYEDMFIGTFHSFGARYLKKMHTPFGRKPNFIIYDDSDSLQLIRTIIKGVKKYGDKDSEELKPARVSEKISAIKNGWLEKKSLENSTYPPDTLLLHIYETYEQALARNNAFDFDDLIKKPVDLLKTDPVARTTLQESIRHLLVDEYQDVNALQAQLIELLVGPKTTITVVGDDAQTIYTWRGSDIHIFLNFDKQYKNTHTIFLEENYRSHKIILDAAQALIDHNSNQKKKTLRAQKEEGEKIHVIEAGTENQEANIVGEKIEERRSETKGQETIAILYRTNAQSRALEQVLVGKTIPYIIYGGIKFYDRKEIKDIIAALRVMYNPQDSVSKDRLETSFTKTRFKQVAPHLTSETELTPEIAIKNFLDASDYSGYIQKYLKNVKERVENIQELLRFAKEFDNLGVFLEQVSLVQAVSNRKSSKNPVQLMSMHSAKGLEFDCVYIVGAQEKNLPHQMSLFSKEQIEEERRLLYVAITRARKHLTISYWGQPSRFLFEIPADLTEFESVGYMAQSLDDSSDERYISFD